MESRFFFGEKNAGKFVEEQKADDELLNYVQRH